MMTIRIPTLALALLVLGTGRAQAAEFCVSDGTQLRAALLFARANGQADIIRLTTGFFAYPGGGTFTYQPDVNSGETHGIEISGGWTPFFGNPCGQQFGTTAFSTVITGAGNDPLLKMDLPISNANTRMTVRQITFLGGGSSGLQAGGATLTANAVGFTGTLRVDRCAFLNNLKQNGGAGAAALHMRSQGGTLRLSNSLFRENHSVSGGVAVNLQLDTGIGAYTTNNTIIDNTNDGEGAAAAVRAYGVAQSLIANNNIWGNDNTNLSFSGNTFLRNNNIQSSVGPMPLEDTNNISVVPVYETGGSLNYTPAVGSPLHDGGTQPPFFLPIPTPFDDNWTTGTFDVFSRNRVQGPQIDIGAYESDGDIIFLDGFDQPDE